MPLAGERAAAANRRGAIGLDMKSMERLSGTTGLGRPGLTAIGGMEDSAAVANNPAGFLVDEDDAI